MTGKKLSTESQEMLLKRVQSIADGVRGSEGTITLNASDCDFLKDNLDLKKCEELGNGAWIVPCEMFCSAVDSLSTQTQQEKIKPKTTRQKAEG